MIFQQFLVCIFVE